MLKAERKETGKKKLYCQWSKLFHVHCLAAMLEIRICFKLHIFKLWYLLHNCVIGQLTMEIQANLQLITFVNRIRFFLIQNKASESVIVDLCTI